jgi:hypothetical protein
MKKLLCGIDFFGRGSLRGKEGAVKRNFIKILIVLLSNFYCDTSLQR